MLCTHKTTFSASLDYFVTSSPPYLHRFSTIFGGNCIRHPCQTGWARSGGRVWTRQVVGWRISVHAFYSSNPDPQHHARVWMSEIQIRIHCDVPHVTYTLFGRISSQPTNVIFMRLGRTYQTCTKNYSHSSVAFSE